MGRRKKFALSWPVIIVGALLIWQWFNSTSSTSVPTTSRQAEQSGTRPMANLDYANRGGDNSWPAVADHATGIAADLGRVNYYVVFDGSGSMADVDCSGGQPKLRVAQDALIRFTEQIPQNANLGLFVFDGDGMSERVALGGDNREQVSQSIRRVTAAAGTPLSVAIHTGYQSLTNQAARQLGYGEYHLVVVTDGVASRGYEPSAEVEAMLQKSPIVLHTIGFCIAGDHSLNQQGRAYYRAANDPESLERSLESVLAEEPDFQATSFQDGNG